MKGEDRQELPQEAEESTRSRRKWRRSTGNISCRSKRKWKDNRRKTERRRRRKGGQQ